MPTLDDVFRKFGEASEAAQLLETELGTVLLFFGAVDDGLITPTLQTSQVDSKRAADLLRRIDRQTLGQLIRNTKQHTDALESLEPLLWAALKERNRLAHSFYRRHSFRKFSEAGRVIMMQDLETIHDTLLKAYKALMLLSGIDLDAAAEQAAKARERLGLEPSPARSN